MAEKQAVGGRVAGFYEKPVSKRRREDEENEENKLVVGEEGNGIYEVERVMEMKKMNVSLGMLKCNRRRVYKLYRQ